MSKLTKKEKIIQEKLDPNLSYSVDEAMEILQSVKSEKFDESVDISVKLGVDPNKSDQNVRGVINLPKGSGKKIKVAVVTSEENYKTAKESGADVVGGLEFIEEMLSSKLDFDILISSPDMMPKLGKAAKILGPRGLMPNPKLGTVTKEIEKAVKDAKSGQVKFKNEKSGIVHAGIGKLSFSAEDILLNLKTFYSHINKNKPDAVKGAFIKKVTIASTMGVGLKINQASLR